ncbi:hypothetical protein VNO77_19950 [Canavalia gladiata]|uniref:Uncharacterized protein n=1 Tax=Canavalia gladiata TaxID=3824 RepID=A0AAN9QLY0_CANGL
MGRNLVLLVSTIMAEVESILVSQKLYDLSLASPYSYHTKQSSCCFRLQMLNHNFQCGFQPTNHTTLIMQISVPGITLDSILLLTRNTHNKPVMQIISLGRALTKDTPSRKKRDPLRSPRFSFFDRSCLPTSPPELQPPSRPRLRESEKDLLSPPSLESFFLFSKIPKKNPSPKISFSDL